MIHKIIVCVAIVVTSFLLADITPQPTSAPVQLQQDMTTEEYWTDRGYERVASWWCAGEHIAVQLYKDHELITISYDEHEVTSCYGDSDSCYVDFIDEVKVLYTWE